ncbi:protein tyrosine phosphatase family protein [Breoghania sp. JC706]|uniref:protein tyrosine phosphatase family protein n=1 Tax=Breoghania sp. JC706 TaxID=3117732 RepID=UPI00300A545F
MIDEILNLRKVSDTYWTAGQPSEEQLAEVREQGFDRVINLAPQDPRYSLDDEAGLVASLGMKYVLIPIDFKNPTLEDYDRFEAEMRAAENERVFIHCAANYRVTAVFGLYAVRNLGWSMAEWDEFIADVWDISEFPVWVEYKKTLEEKTKELVK